MQPTSLRVYFNFQSNKKFFRDYFSTCLVSGGPPTRGRFVSRSFSDLPRLHYLSWHPASPLPLYFPHGASLSLTSLSFISSQPPPLVLIVSLQILRTFYTTYLPLSATLTFAHVGRYSLPPIPPSLICSTKFPEKMMVPSPDT